MICEIFLQCPSHSQVQCFSVVSGKVSCLNSKLTHLAKMNLNIFRSWSCSVKYNSSEEFSLCSDE